MESMQQLYQSHTDAQTPVGVNRVETQSTERPVNALKSYVLDMMLPNVLDISNVNVHSSKQAIDRFDLLITHRQDSLASFCECVVSRLRLRTEHDRNSNLLPLFKLECLADKPERVILVCNWL
jgi:hypothetical protein